MIDVLKLFTCKSLESACILGPADISEFML